MAPFSQDEKLAISEKIALQITSTTSDKFWYNELFPSLPLVNPKNILTEMDTIPGASSLAQAQANVIAHPTILEEITVHLTVDLTSNYCAFILTDTFGDMSTRIQNSISPALIETSGSPSYGYSVRLYDGDPDSGGVELTTGFMAGGDGSPSWSFSYSMGVLFVSQDVASTFQTMYDNNGLYVRVFHYIGETGGGGGGSSSLTVKENDDDPTGLNIDTISFNGNTGIEGERVLIVGATAYINPPPIPDPLQGVLSCSSPRYQARESEDIIPTNTTHKVNAGEPNVYTINDSAIISAPASFGNSSVGDLTLELNGVVICTIELGNLFNDTNRDVGQNMLDYNGISSDGTVVTNGVGEFIAPYVGMGDITITSVQSNTTGIAADPYQECTCVINILTTGTNNISEILRSGYNTLQLFHEANNTELLELYYDYDTEITPNQPEPTVDTATMVEDTPVIKYLSGVRYYDGGSTFSVGVIGRDCFDNVYHVSGRPITYDDNSNGSDWGIDETGPTDGIHHTNVQVTGVSNPPVFAEDMIVGGYIITVPENQYTTDARFRFFARDPYLDPHDSDITASNNFLIESHSASSTRLIERFYEENWRCPLTGDFDNPNAKNWTSSDHVNSDDAVFTNGGCERNITDWTIYNPDMVGQPDYSGAYMDSEVVLIREFMHTNGTASSGFTLDTDGIGSFNSLEMKLANTQDGTASGGTVWVNMLSDYNFSDWNNGDPQGGTGCRTGVNHYTFGSNNINNCGSTVYIRITFNSGQRISGEWEIIFD